MRFAEVDNPTDLQKRVAMAIAEGPRGSVKGAFIPLMHSPGLASHLQALGAYLRFETTLRKDLRAIAILSAAAEFKCSYEWCAHERITRAGGLLGDAVIDAIGCGATSPAFTAEQAITYRFVLAMLRGGKVDDELFHEMQTFLGNAALLDLVGLCGYFSMVAMVLNVSQHPLPADALPRYNG